MAPRTYFLLVLACATLLRVWAIFGGEVDGTNAYYYLCAQVPAPAYFDGPAGTAMCVRSLAGFGDTWLALGPLWAIAASLALLALGRRLAGEAEAAWAGIALNVVPAFNAAALDVGPLLPALTFSLLGACFVWDAVGGQSSRWGSWFAAGAAFVGGALFAYWAALFGLAAALAPFARTRCRTAANYAGLAWVLAALCAALIAPWKWNAAREFIPVAGWTLRGLAAFDGRAFLAGAADLVFGISPVLAAAALVAFVRVSQASSQEGRQGFAAVLAVPGIALGAMATYRGWPSAWAALPAVAALLPSACGMLYRNAALWWAGLVVAAVFSAPVFSRIANPRGPIGEVADRVLEIDDSLADDLPGGLFYIAGDTGLAATLGYQLRNAIIPPEGHPPVYELESQAIASQFAFWPSYADFVDVPEHQNELFTEARAANPFVGHSAVYVGREKPDGLPQAIRGAFSDVQLVREIGPPEDRLYIYLCLDYQTMPL